MATSFTGRIRGWSAFLGRVPSLIYVTAYLLCIPVFAFFYWMTRDSFYHTTVQFEESLHLDTRELQLDLEKAIIHDHQLFVVSSNGWVFDVRGIEIADLTCEESQRTFYVRSGNALTKGEEPNKECRSLDKMKVAVRLAGIEHIE
jgi:hypothetical protein